MDYQYIKNTFKPGDKVVFTSKIEGKINTTYCTIEEFREDMLGPDSGPGMFYHINKCDDITYTPGCWYDVFCEDILTMEFTDEIRNYLINI